MADSVLLIPCNVENTVYKAFLHTPVHSYEVKVVLPPSMDLVHARLEGDWRLSNIIRGQEDLIKQYLAESKSVSELLVHIRDLLTQLESSTSSPHASSLPLNVCRQLASDISSLGWSKVQSVDTLFRHIKILTMDRSNRAHTLTVSPTLKYPQEPPLLRVDAPVEFKPSWDTTTGLCELVSQFSLWLDSLEPFWSCMDELDTHTCILEPEHPSKAHTHRRILLATHLSVVLHVNPHRPCSLPEPLQFLGPDNKVRELKKMVWKNSAKWNESVSLLSNLQTLLDVDFPQPSSEQAQEMSEECGICYDCRLNGSVPSIVCSNMHCAKSFHDECFKEWLRGLPKVDGFHTVRLTGDCPFCGQFHHTVASEPLYITELSGCGKVESSTASQGHHCVHHMTTMS